MPGAAWEAGPNIRKVGLAQRLLIWVMLASIVVMLASMVGAALVVGSLDAHLVVPAMIMTIPFQLYCVYKLAKALDMATGIAVLWLVSMLIPLVSLVCLLVLNGKATRTLKSAGIRVGLMGASVAELPSD